MKNIDDDIIIHGKTKKEHDEALENCLKRLETLKLKVKGESAVSIRKKSNSMGCYLLLKAPSQIRDESVNWSM